MEAATDAGIEPGALRCGQPHIDDVKIAAGSAPHLARTPQLVTATDRHDVVGNRREIATSVQFAARPAGYLPPAIEPVSRPR